MNLAHLDPELQETDEIYKENQQKNARVADELNKAFYYIQSKVIVSVGEMKDESLSVQLATDVNYMPF